MAEVVQEEPVLQLLIDSREQRIRRPKGWPAQKPFYSGKKKAHTLKCQAAVSVDGRVQALSPSVPGPMSDLTLLRQGRLAEQLTEEEALAADRGYPGLEKDYPAVDFYLPLKKTGKQPLTDEQKALGKALAFVRVTIEHTFGRMNRFGACAQIFRQRRSLHSRVVRVIAPAGGPAPGGA